MRYLVVALLPLLACGSRDEPAAPDTASTGAAAKLDLAPSYAMQDCMPMPEGDHVDFLATLTVTNPTASAIGPFSNVRVELVDPFMTPIAKFDLDPPTAAFGPHTTTTVDLEKRRGSLSPISRCTLCGPRHLVVTFSGPGLPNGTTVVTTDATFDCPQ